MFQSRTALRKLPAAENTVQLRDILPRFDCNFLGLHLHLRVQEHVSAVFANRRLRLAQDHRLVSYLPATQVQRRWKRRSELHRFRHDPRDVPDYKCLDLLQPLLFAHGHSGYHLRNTVDS